MKMLYVKMLQLHSKEENKPSKINGSGRAIEYSNSKLFPTYRVTVMKPILASIIGHTVCKSTIVHNSSIGYDQVGEVSTGVPQCAGSGKHHHDGIAHHGDQ